MTARPPAHPGRPYFDAVAEHLGEAYLRYGFTKGTRQEVEFVVEIGSPARGKRLLDVGCGPGRHAVGLAEAGFGVTGVDISRRFLDIAAEHARRAGVAASFFEVDARQMPFDNEFEVAISLCQGGFGLMGADDGLVLRRIAEALRPGGVAMVTAFNAYYQAANLHPGAHFDASNGICHELTTVKNEEGVEAQFDLWTGVYTPRELHLLALGVGLAPRAIYAVEPGDYERRPPDIEHTEFLLVADKPPVPSGC